MSDNEPTAEQIQASLNLVVRDSLKPAALTLFAVYTLYAVLHPFVLPEASRFVMSIAAAVTWGISLFLVDYFWKREIPAVHANRFAAVLFGLVWLNLVIHTALTPLPDFTVNFVVLMIASSAVVLSFRWNAVFIGACLLVWGISIVRNPTADWWLSAPIMVVGVLVTSFVRGIRYHTHRQYEIQRCIAQRMHLEAVRLHAQLEQATKLIGLGEMTSGIAHDVRNGLAVIIQFSGGAKRRANNGKLTLEKSLECFDDIYDQADKTKEILARVQKFTGHRPNERVPVDLSEIYSDVQILLGSRMKHLGIRMEWKPCQMPSKLIADPTQLLFVLVNLVTGSIHALAKSDEDRSICISTVLSAPDTLEVCVQDSRPLNKNPDKPDETQFDPLGFGRGLCRTYIEQHGGRLWSVEDASSGHETRFCLPL